MKTLQVSLDPDDAAIAREYLENALGDLRMEIVDTDNPEFRRELRAQRERLERVLAALGAV